MNNRKKYAPVILGAIVVCLLFSSVASAGTVSYESISGGKVSGQGSSAAETTAGYDSIGIPIVQKTVSVYLDDAGKVCQEDSGFDQMIVDGVTVTVDAEEVSACVRVIREGEASAYASIGAMGGIWDDGEYADAEAWLETCAWTETTDGRAKATANAEGSASADVDASGMYWDGATLCASVDGTAASSVSTTRDAYAYNYNDLYAYSDFGSVTAYADIYSDSEAYGYDSNARAAASGSVSGSSVASAYEADGVEEESAYADVLDGAADSSAKVRGIVDSESWNYAGSYAGVPGWDWEWPGLDDTYIGIEIEGAIVDASWLYSHAYADVYFDYPDRSSARVSGAVSADTYSRGTITAPDIEQSSTTWVDGSADSIVSVVKEGHAETSNVALAKNVVDGDVYEIWVELEGLPLFADWGPVDVLDMTWMHSLSEIRGDSDRSRMFAEGSVDAEASSYGQYNLELAGSATSGSAESVAKGRGDNEALAAAAAGSGALWDNATAWRGYTEGAAAGIGTYAAASDDSRTYAKASLPGVSTAAWTSPSVEASVTGGSAKSWVSPYKDKGGASVDGVVYVDGEDMDTGEDADWDWTSIPNNEAWSYKYGWAVNP